jgi:O-succinylbenzoate synthase
VKLTKIEAFHLRMPLIYPFNTAVGNSDANETILVKMSSGTAYGWGEAAPWREPAYSPESAAGVLRHLRKFLTPLVLGRFVTGGEELHKLMSPVKGNRFAKAALDLAFWDLSARVQRKLPWRSAARHG